MTSRMQVTFSSYGQLVTLGRGQKVKYHLHVNFKSFYTKLFVCVLTNKKDRKHIEQNFHSVARVMPRGGTCGCLGESKTLAWGFAMAPHQLRALVAFCKQFRPRLDSTELLIYMYSRGESTMPMGRND